MGVKSVSVSDESWLALESVLSAVFGESAKTKKSAVIQTLLNGIREGTITPQVNLGVDINNLGVINADGSFVSYVEHNQTQPQQQQQQPQVNNLELYALQDTIQLLTQELEKQKQDNVSLVKDNNELRKQIDQLLKDLERCRYDCHGNGGKVTSNEVREQLALTELALSSLASSSQLNLNTPNLNDLELLSLINQVGKKTKLQEIIEYSEDPLSSNTRTDEDFYLSAHLKEVIKGVLSEVDLQGDLYTAELINSQAYFEQLLTDDSLGLPQEVERTISVAKELARLAIK